MKVGDTVVFTHLPGRPAGTIQLIQYDRLGGRYVVLALQPKPTRKYMLVDPDGETMTFTVH